MLPDDLPENVVPLRPRQTTRQVPMPVAPAVTHIGATKLDDPTKISPHLPQCGKPQTPGYSARAHPPKATSKTSPPTPDQPATAQTTPTTGWRTIPLLLG